MTLSAVAVVVVRGNPLPQQSGSSAGDGDDYFGGIYVGDLNDDARENKPTEVEDDDSGDYFGGIYVGDAQPR